MRAVVCAEAIFTRFIASARMRVPPVRWELQPGHAAAVDKNWKPGPRPKFTDYSRDRRSFTLTAGLVVFTACFFLLMCMFDTAWDVPGQRSPGSGFTLGLARPGRALQSNYRLGEAARQKAGALHGMGVTFRLGSRALNELVVAHLAECTTAEELRMFLRTLHRSGVTARADVVLLFPWSVPKDMTRVIDEEERSFQLLMLERKATAPPHSRKMISKDAKELDEAAEDGQISNQGRSSVVQSEPAPEIRFRSANGTISPFNAKAFWRSREERKVKEGEMIWENTTTIGGNESDEMSSLAWADWGSIVGFEMQDLDQGEVLEGFIEDPPAQLRRWTCYQMLLGMMKAKYRTVLLTEVRGVFILRDVLSAARKKAFDSGINLYQEDVSWSDVHTARKKRLSTLNSGVSSSGLKDDHELSREISISRKKEDGREEADSDRNVAQVSGKSEFRPDIGIASQEMHFIEEVYGKEVWKKLDKEDKDKATLNSGFIMGNMRAVRKFSSFMLTEIAALAIKRNSRRAFHDQAVLNHLVQKSSILSRRVTGKLHMLSNSNGPVHSMPGSKQARVFFRDNGRGFAAILGLKDELVANEQAMAIGKSIRDEICSSRKESWAYEDCSH